jgi:hypothetical protein
MSDYDKNIQNALCWIVIAMLFASAAYKSRGGMCL